MLLLVDFEEDVCRHDVDDEVDPARPRRVARRRRRRVRLDAVELDAVLALEAADGRQHVAKFKAFDVAGADEQRAHLLLLYFLRRAEFGVVSALHVLHHVASL